MKDSIAMKLAGICESPKSGLNRILNAEQFLASLPQLDIPVKHTFAHGTYAREIMIPKGAGCTGKIHKYDDLNIVPYGHMSVYDGETWVDVHGPATFVGRAGVKKIGYAHEDTLWITVHATSETDLDVIEQTLFVECENEPRVIDFKTGMVIQEVLQ